MIYHFKANFIQNLKNNVIEQENKPIKQYIYVIISNFDVLPSHNCISFAMKKIEYEKILISFTKNNIEEPENKSTKKLLMCKLCKMKKTCLC